MRLSEAFSALSFGPFPWLSCDTEPFLTVPGKSRGEPRGCLAVMDCEIYNFSRMERERAEKKNVCLDVFGEKPHTVLTGSVLTSDSFRGLCGLDTFVWIYSQAFTFKPRTPNSDV